MRASCLDGLKESIIPVEPVYQTFRVKVLVEGGKWQTCTVLCYQFLIITATVYPFTDYRTPGQTLPCVITDIVTPLNGRLSLFNLYVALSRSSG
ncbi:hypothetical protein NEOLEDRAFT_1058786 [Neolentinus lepideus HHB14362 ss-1]|uniref:Uncharacterized protein n=1 Tax=Neolentinus lepideus HHB14362 ss-1 TaxID=1314782 RepID=A0A165UMI1_9AGAM|nr:hypothetical protein NEOLEDRAFT_1058786 [Neolentinus lepideus HHB14362 ss-1]